MFVFSIGFYAFPFTTVRCWGENPVGKWTLKLHIKNDRRHDFNNADRFIVNSFRILGTQRKTIPKNSQEVPQKSGIVTPDDLQLIFDQETYQIGDR
ncbi:hypothetical protein GJ496_006410 [Pomphorhynchus laevis]|nr:hypothetical protein GJ496_006410 [Pomphorhynchus laevis]